MKDVRKALESSSLIKNNEFVVLNWCKCLAIGRLHNETVLVYANKHTLEFHIGDKEKLESIYIDFNHQIVNCVGKPTPNFDLV